MKVKRLKKAMLVYQAGIANVFEVDCFNLSSYGRKAVRLMQSDFRTCLAYARGLGDCGVVVRTAHCNEAGDIVDRSWNEDLSEAPFRESIVDYSRN